MKLYLVQHADAKKEDENPLRPLTDKGKHEIDKVAEYIKRSLKVTPERILHSPKLRAKQTAEILAKHLNLSEKISTSDDLKPLADPRIWADRLIRTDQNLLLVGHLPNLSKLASYLLIGDQKKDILKFQVGSIACFNRDQKGHWSLEWMISPQFCRYK